MKKLSLIFISMIISLNCYAAITLVGPTGAPDFSGIATFELSDLLGTSFGNQIPALVLDGTTTDATNVFATGIFSNADGNQSIFLIATKDIPAGAANFSTDLVLMVGGDASTGGGVGRIQLITNQHTGPSGFGGNIDINVKGSDNGTGGTLSLITETGVKLKINHKDSAGQIGEYLTSITATGGAEWASLKGKFRTTDPCGDTTNFPEATMFYNDTSDYYCFCNGSGTDVQMHSPATACF